MYKNIIYPTKSIYLGMIESIQDDDKIDRIIAFHQKVDKVTLEISYIPLAKEIGYYYLKKIEPIKRHMSKKELAGLLTLTQINQIVARENKKERVNHLVSPITVPEPEPNKKTGETSVAGYQQTYENKGAKPKVMQYSASHDKKVA